MLHWYDIFLEDDTTSMRVSAFDGIGKAAETHVYHGDELIASSQIDSMGEFSFTNVIFVE